MTFANITESDFLAILNHYRTQRSGFDSFGFDTATLAADLTPSGFAWLYANPPQVVDDHTNCFTVTCEFKCEPRGLVVAPGKAWRTIQSTLSPGARSGGVVYGAGAAWASSSTTLRPGVRNSGVGSNGVSWETASTTFWPQATPDPYFSSVVLLAGFNGANGSTTFVDEGPLGLTLTTQGSPQISTTQSVFGGSSLRLDVDSWLVLPINSNLVLSGDFTIDARCRFNVPTIGYNGKMMLLSGRAGGPSSQISRGNSGGPGYLSVLTTGFNFPEAVFSSDAPNTWFALRWARSGSTIYFFADGALLGSGACPSGFDFSGGRIGSSFEGYIDELRISNVCRSTSSYTVDTSPFPRG